MALVSNVRPKWIETGEEDEAEGESQDLPGDTDMSGEDTWQTHTVTQVTLTHRYRGLHTLTMTQVLAAVVLAPV